MSVIQSIRDKYAAIGIAFIALSLIAFIAMDAFVGRGRGASTGDGNIGKINGQTVSRGDFEKKLSLTQAMYGQQAPQRDQLINQTWDQTVDEIVMNQEYEKLGMQITGKELNDILFGANPPQWLSQQFTDQATGQFNAEEARKAIGQFKKAKDNPNSEMVKSALSSTVAQTLRTKYMALLSNSSYVPKWMAERSFADQNATARFSYVSVPYTSITDTTIKVSDDDIKAYMNKHKEMFKQDEGTRSVSYVAFNASPSANDSAKVMGQVENLKNDFTTAPDPEAFLGKVGSELPYLNGYTLGSKMQVPFADTIKMLAVGEVFGPYVDGPNYAMAKMIDKRSMADSVKVRHILIKTGQGGLADSIAKIRIDSIANAAKTGADFNALVQTYSDDAGSKNTKGEYTFSSTQFANLSKEFAEVAFYGNTGTKQVVKVENQSYSGYHYIEVLEQKNFETAYKIAYLAKAIDASQETINTASNRAAEFAANSRDKKSFDDNAAKQNLTPMSAPDLKQSDFQIPALGESRQFVRWVYEAEAGDVSEPFEINDKYVVAVVTASSEKGMMSVAKARASAEPLILNEKKAQRIIETKFKASGSMEQIAQGAGVPLLVADSVGFAQPFIQNIGNEPKLIGAAFNKSLQGKVSEPIAGNTGVFVIKGESISASPNVVTNVESMRTQMEQQQKQMSGYRSLDALKKAAKVDDNRFTFY